jgi:hypothetical protein
MSILQTHLFWTAIVFYIIYISVRRNIILTVLISSILFSVLLNRIVTRYNPRLSTYYNMNTPPLDESSKGFNITKIYNKDLTKNILVTSLYGNDSKYYKNIDSTLKTIDELGVEWQYRIYLHDKVRSKIRDSLISKGIQVYIVSDPLTTGGMNSAGAFWRFMPLLEDIRFIVVDADDDLDTESLKTTISKWETSRKPFMRHVLPTFLFPKSHVSAGMWGGFGCGSLGCGKDLQTYNSRSPFGSDEIYMNTSVLIFMKRYGLVSFFGPISTICHVFRHPLINSEDISDVNEYIPRLYNKL